MLILTPKIFHFLYDRGTKNPENFIKFWRESCVK